MECKDVQQEIPSLLYGELGEEAARTLRAHIDACPRCRRELEQYGETLSLLDTWEGPDATLNTAAIMENAAQDTPRAAGRTTTGFAARFAARSAPRGPRLPGARWIALAAVLVLAVTLAVTGMEIRRAPGGVVITLGRPHGAEAYLAADLEPGLRRMVRSELDGNTERVFEAVATLIDATARKQDERQMLLARALSLQREEDLRFTRNLVRQIALTTAADSEETRLLLEEMALVVHQEDSENPKEQF